MIDLRSLKFGDKVYIAKEDNHVLAAKKIKIVDDNGVEWYRYDRDRFTYSIETITYCGKVTYVAEGEFRFSEDHRDEYHFKHGDGNIYYEYCDDEFLLRDWFKTQEEAELRIQSMKASRRG